MLLGDGEVGGVDLEEGGGGGDGVAAGVGVSGDGGRDDSVLDFSVASVAQAPKPRGFNLKRDAEHVVHRDFFDIERHVQVHLPAASLRCLYLRCLFSPHALHASLNSRLLKSLSLSVTRPSITASLRG